MQRTDIIRIIAMVAAVTLVVLGGAYLLGGFEGVGGHGVGALIVGVIISLALGIGLMALMYASYREHDESAYHAAKENFRAKSDE